MHLYGSLYFYLDKHMSTVDLCEGLHPKHSYIYTIFSQIPTLLAEAILIARSTHEQLIIIES